jgi:hypothetical protein
MQVSHEEPVNASITARRATVRGVNLVNEAKFTLRSSAAPVETPASAPATPKSTKKAGDGVVKLRMKTLP